MTFPHRWLGHNIFLYPTQEDLFPRFNSHSACLSTANYIIGLILLSRVVSRRGRSNLWVLRPHPKHTKLTNDRTWTTTKCRLPSSRYPLETALSLCWSRVVDGLALVVARILKQNKNQFGGNVIKINVTLYSELCLLRASLRYCRCCCWSHSFIPGRLLLPLPHTLLLRSGFT